MQVEPAKLVELAATSENILSSMAQDWATALADLGGACGSLGDATGASILATTYADSLSDAGDVVTALTNALGLGIAGLVDAAQDAARTDDTVATELDRATHLLGEGPTGYLPGPGGR